jgi:hypothetical protein
MTLREIPSNCGNLQDQRLQGRLPSSSGLFTVCEALELVLSPDRLSRIPPVVTFVSGRFPFFTDHCPAQIPYSTYAGKAQRLPMWLVSSRIDNPLA